MSRFKTIFPNVNKPLIAMAHVPPLPGTPLFNASKGVQGLIDHVKRETELLLEAGFDAILFCNEGDRPYQLHAGLEASAIMARVVTECKPSDRPYGVDFLWDAGMHRRILRRMLVLAAPVAVVISVHCGEMFRQSLPFCSLLVTGFSVRAHGL